MKKACLLPIFLFGLLLPFVACSESDEGNEPNPLIGYWYITDNSGIVSLRIDDNGTGEATVYKYSGSEWDIKTSPLQYTIADGHIAIRAGNNYTLSGRMAITGKSLSVIHNDDNIFMFTGYNGGENTISSLRTNIENNFTQDEDNDTGGDNNGNSGNDSTTNDDNADDEITITPDNDIIHESFWNSEANVASAMATTYLNQIEFIKSQLDLEKTRTTGLDLKGIPQAISATDEKVEECWTNAYRAINLCNAIIGHAPNEYIDYINEARAVRCLLYYNVAHLWNKAVYTTKAYELDEVLSSPVLDEKEIFTRINEEIDLLLDDFENSRFGDFGIDAGSLIAIKAEIELNNGNKSVARELLSQCHPQFSLSINEEQEKELFTIFGDKIALYTPEYVELLKSETEDTEGLTTLWEVTDTPAYGYWAMLKRIGKAQEVSGCKEHELLMPIPHAVLIHNSKITQNPGY